MQKLRLLLLAITLAVVTLVGAAVPVAAAPGGNRAVAWVDSSINYAAYAKPMHPRHSLTVKLLADGATVGQVVAGVGTERMYSTETEIGAFLPGKTYFWTWNDDGVEVKMADFAAFLYIEATGKVGLIRYQIADYGEPGVNDWHRVWFWMLDHWQPVYGADLRIPYVGGNAIVHGDISVTGAPADWNPNNLGILLPSPKQ